MGNEGPLHGLRVIDLTRLLPGPVATGMLADMGADVIKVEETALVRAGMPRDVLAGRDAESDAFLCAFNSVARGKRSIAVDCHSEAGSEVIRRLAATADVFVEAYRPGVLDHCRLDYATLSALNPRLVYCSMSGFGDGGPYRNRPAHNENYAAIAGLTSVSSDAEGRPVGMRAAFIDLTTSYFAVIGVLAALRERDRSGRGQRVQVPMLAAALHLTSNFLARYFRDGHVPRRGRQDATILETADGRYLVSQNGEEHFWQAFCEAIGHPEFLPMRRLPYTDRTKFYDQMRTVIKAKTRDEWMEIFKDKDVCVTPVLEMDEVPLDPQVGHLGMVRELTHERYGEVRQLAFPIFLDRTPWEFPGFAPALGQHNEELLRELGYDADEIRALYDADVIAKVEG